MKFLFCMLYHTKLTGFEKAFIQQYLIRFNRKIGKFKE